MGHQGRQAEGVGVYPEDRPIPGILITSFTHSQGISMQIILKGHAVKRDIYSVPNGVYTQSSPLTGWLIYALVQFKHQGVLPIR